MKIRSIILSVTALALAGCGQSESTDDTAQESADAVESATDIAEPAADDGDAETKEAVADPAKPADDVEDKGMVVKIAGFECGDNCYLDYRPVDAADGTDTQSALCSVGACEDWFSVQEMPAEFVGRSARIVVGTGKQYDNAGNVMSNDFAEVTAITIDPAE